MFEAIISLLFPQKKKGSRIGTFHCFTKGNFFCWCTGTRDVLESELEYENSGLYKVQATGRIRINNQFGLPRTGIFIMGPPTLTLAQQHPWVGCRNRPKVIVSRRLSLASGNNVACDRKKMRFKEND
jgi:hypothetical protein